LLYLFFASSILDDLLAEEFPTQKEINESLEELDAKRYLQAMLLGNSPLNSIQLIILGKADIAPVVERARMPQIYLGCRLKTSELFSHKNEWLHQNRWYLYSAYEDRRNNSLYPVLVTSIQVI
jgi:hypothetical protein